MNLEVVIPVTSVFLCVFCVNYCLDKHNLCKFLYRRNSLEPIYQEIPPKYDEINDEGNNLQIV